MTITDTQKIVAIERDLDNAVDGLGALSADIGTVDTAVGNVQTDLDNAVDGLGALKSLIDAVDDMVSPAEIIENCFDIDMGYWTEVDAPGRVTIDYTNERIAIADLDNDEDVYVYKATSANVTDFILDFEFQVLNTAVHGSLCIGLGDGIGTAKDVDNGLYIHIYHDGVNDNRCHIYHMTGGADTSSGGIDSLLDDTTYYGRLIRRGSYVWLGVYSDRIWETHVAGSPREYKDTTPVAFTHLYPLAARDNGTTAKAMDAYIERIKLISAPDIDKYLGHHVE